jgi:ATP-dependent RNA helicase DeaD
MMNQNLFETLSVSPEVLDAVKELNYIEMTPIQASAIPLILCGQDVIGRSSTGTGKTAAFGIPAVEKATRILPNKPQTLILAPTRELALQISGELKKFAKYKPAARVATIYGGDPMPPQMAALRIANIVVGTPGRVMDHMRRGTLLLDDLSLVVLDEADEMLNMGFVDDIKEILSATPESRQTLLFSATMPPAIMGLTREFQRDPKVVAVDGGQRTLDTIEQFYYHVPQAQKMQALNLLLQGYGQGRAVVFCNTRRMVDDLVEYLSVSGFSATGLHGEMSQSVRTKVMSDFKSGRLNVLVATDVAARGIDVEDVKAVFNFDIPADNEYYIHRIGRTGRAGRKGASHTLACNPTQIRRIKELERFLRAPIARAYLPKKEALHAMRQDAARERLLASMNTMDNLTWGPVIDELAGQGLDVRAIACTLMQLLEGANRMEIPEVSDIVPIARPQQAPSKAAAPRRREMTGDTVLLTASVGRNQRIAPNFIVSAIVEGASVPASAIGKIDIFSDNTRIEVTPEAAKRILQTMQLTRIKNNRVRFSLAEPRRPYKPKGK